MLPGMANQLWLRCRCGEVRGVASELAPERGSHVFCYCDDCQAYIRFLDRDEILDAHGGTEIFQITPAQLRITAGTEHVRCLRLSDKGLMRWYAGCCKTPIGNSLSSPRAPFAGLLLCCVDPASDPPARERAVGPVIARAFGRFARGGMPPNAVRGMPLGWLLRMIRLQTRAWLAGKHQPSPFFTPGGIPTVTPQVLTPAQREQLRASGG